MSKHKPWEVFPEIWSSEAKFIAYVRGGVRRSIWSRYPIKTEFMKAKRVRKVNPKTGKMCYGFDCTFCKNFFPQASIEIDHVSGNNKFTSVEDSTSYLKALLYINFEDLQPACKPCHRVKSYAERMGITFEEAEKKKKVIALMKNKEEVDKTLVQHNLPCNNDKTRRNGLERLIEEGLLECN